MNQNHTVKISTLLELKEGDIVQHKMFGTMYIVTGNYGQHVTAVNTVDITNPSEWLVLRDAGLR